MNKLTATITSLFVSTILLTGCGTTNKVTKEKYSGFLNDYSILKPTPGDKDTLGYVTPNIDWTKYNSVMIDKVLVITPDGKQKVDGKLLVAIADKFQELLKQKLAKQFNVVNYAGNGTIRLQVAITSVFSSYDDMKGYQYIPIAAAVTGAKRAAGAENKNVRVMSELKMIDSVNGQLLAQVADLKGGAKKQNKDSEVLLVDVVPILQQWTQRISDRIVGLRSQLK